MSDFIVKEGFDLGASLKAAVGTVTGNATLDLSTGNDFSLTPTDNVTFTFSNPPATGAYDFTLKLTGELIDNGYDLANATKPFEPYGKFSVAGEETLPTDLFFKSDGTKMYIVGQVSDSINEYDLSTAWDISTASYVQNFSVSTEELNPAGLFFKSDGTKMYVLGDAGQDVNEYTLSAAWDISTASYLQNFSVATEETSPKGLFFKPDGSKMYVVGSSGDDVNEYDLSTAWDVSTASYLQNFSVSAQETFPTGLFFKPDGTKMYVMGVVGDDVNEYSLSSAWDISTASYVQNFSVGAQETAPNGVFLGDNGTKMYITGTVTDAVYSYTLTSAWDISSSSWDAPATAYFSVAADDNSPKDIFFKPDGTKMYILGDGGDDVNEYNLSSAWEISTASYVQNFSVSAQENQPQGFYFKPDGTKMYIIGLAADEINEYTLSSGWDISTASYVQNFSVSAQETNPQGIFFKPDGTKMYIVGYTGDDVNEYTLSSAWDISTASYVQNFSVSTQDTAPTDIFFKDDGTKMFVIGQSGDNVNEYSLSSAWDISTASYVQNFNVNTQESNPDSVFFGDNGTKMYITGGINRAVWQYSTGTYGDAIFTYPASVKWPAGTPPTAPADGETDVLTFFTTDGGTTYYGIRTGDDMS